MATQTHCKIYKIRALTLTATFLIIFLLSITTKAANYGIASWYGGGEKLNLRTATGEIFNPHRLTCATWEHPLGSKLKVTNIKNGKSVVVRVNDRGPNRRLGRAIDLTKRAFAEIADPRKGLVLVEIERTQ